MADTCPGVTVPQLLRFHTAEVPAGQRVALWEDHNRNALIGLRCRMISEVPFEGITGWNS